MEGQKLSRDGGKEGCAAAAGRTLLCFVKQSAFCAPLRPSNQACSRWGRCPVIRKRSPSQTFDFFIFGCATQAHCSLGKLFLSTSWGLSGHICEMYMSVGVCEGGMTSNCQQEPSFQRRNDEGIMSTLFWWRAQAPSGEGVSVWQSQRRPLESQWYKLCYRRRVHSTHLTEERWARCKTTLT